MGGIDSVQTEDVRAPSECIQSVASDQDVALQPRDRLAHEILVPRGRPMITVT